LIDSTKHPARVELFSYGIFVKDGITQIQNATDAARCDSKILHRYHFEMLAKDGIFFLPGKLGAISLAHSISDVKAMIDASNRFLTTL